MCVLTWNTPCLGLLFSECSPSSVHTAVAPRLSWVCFRLAALSLFSWQCTICVICIYKLKWLWVDWVWIWRTLDVFIDARGGHRKLNVTGLLAGFREAALAPDQLILRCPCNPLSKTRQTQRAARRGRPTRLLFFQIPQFSLGNCLVWDLKPDLFCWYRDTSTEAVLWGRPSSAWGCTHYVRTSILFMSHPNSQWKNFNPTPPADEILIVTITIILQKS